MTPLGARESGHPARESTTASNPVLAGDGASFRAGLLLRVHEAQRFLGLRRDVFYRHVRNDPTFPKARRSSVMSHPMYYRPDLEAWAAQLGTREVGT